MAEAYLKKRLSEENIPMEIRSAGIIGMQGMPPSENTIKVLEEEKVSAEDLESKPLTKETISWADMILVMEPIHKASIIDMVPAAESKIFYLGDFNKDTSDVVIPDPIGRPLAFYRTSLGIIKKATEELVEWLKK
jgi:protein-tyrosine-phosphatase